MDKGILRPECIPTGQYTQWQAITINLESVESPVELKFKLKMDLIENEWSVWVFPTELEPELQSNAVIVEDCGAEFEAALESGKDILILPRGNIENGRDVIQFFSPVFWNTSWFQMNPPHTLGLLIDDKHPLFDDFPTAFYSDYHWWELVHRQPVANLELFPKDYEPIVASIDTWFINRKLGILFEMRCRKSRVIICTCDLHCNLIRRPVAQLLRSRIKKYVGSASFQPKHQIDSKVLCELFEKKQRPVYDCMTHEKPDELIPQKL